VPNRKQHTRVEKFLSFDAGHDANDRVVKGAEIGHGAASLYKDSRQFPNVAADKKRKRAMLFDIGKLLDIAHQLSGTNETMLVMSSA
jgi:hypothetical protein